MRSSFLSAGSAANSAPETASNLFLDASTSASREGLADTRGPRSVIWLLLTLTWERLGQDPRPSGRDVRALWEAFRVDRDDREARSEGREVRRLWDRSRTFSLVSLDRQGSREKENPIN